MFRQLKTSTWRINSDSRIKTSTARNKAPTLTGQMWNWLTCSHSQNECQSRTKVPWKSQTRTWDIKRQYLKNRSNFFPINRQSKIRAVKNESNHRKQTPRTQLDPQQRIQTSSSYCKCKYWATESRNWPKPAPDLFDGWRYGCDDKKSRELTLQSDSSG